MTSPPSPSYRKRASTVSRMVDSRPAHQGHPPAFSTPEHRRVLSSTNDAQSNISTPSSSRTLPLLTTPNRPAPASPSLSPTSRHLTVDILLAQYPDNPAAALEHVLTERNALAAQNAQLWKLIERQRAQTKTLEKDVDRLRAERDRALGRRREPSEERAERDKERDRAAEREKEKEKENENEKEKGRPPLHTRHTSDEVVPRLHTLTTSRSLDPIRAAAFSSQASPPAVPHSATYDSLPSASSGRSTQALPAALQIQRPAPTAPSISVTSSQPSPTSGPSVQPPSRSDVPTALQIQRPAPTAPSISVTPTPPTSANDTSTSNVSMVNGNPPPTSPSPTESAPPKLPPRGLSPSPPSLPPRKSTSPISSSTTSPPSEELSNPTPPPPAPAPSLPPRRTEPDPPDYARPSSPPRPPTTVVVPPSPAPASSSTVPSSEGQPPPLPRRTVSPSQPPRPTTQPHLSPSDLPITQITVSHSTIRPNDRGKDVLSFHIAVAPPAGTPWAVEKLYSDVLALDARVRAPLGRSAQKKLGVLPEGKAFRDHAPVKADQRKAALTAYLQSLLLFPLPKPLPSELCTFFTSDITRAAPTKSGGLGIAREGYKEGYLTKRGKNFGGWKTRYFVLQSPILEYYESRGGAHLGSIHLANAQIGRQQRTGAANAPSAPAAPLSTVSENGARDEDDNAYRHAFLIIEARRGLGGQPNRHVLCAETDRERDSWVEHLVRYVISGEGEASSNVKSASSESLPRASVDEPRTSSEGPHGRRRARTTSKDEISRGLQAVPISQLVPDADNAKLFHAAPPPTESPPAHDPAQAQQRSTSALGTYVEPSSAPADPRAVHSFGTSAAARLEQRQSMLPPPERAASPSKAKISGPINATPITAGYGGKLGTSASVGSLAVPAEGGGNERERKAKSGRFWGFGRLADKVNPSSAPGPPPLAAPSAPLQGAVFGVPLPESLAVAVIANLPAVVFRCIEYLEAKHAELEEGIYRLSGSSAVIKSLRDRFNIEGDFNLLASDEYWDLHAVAGLLKGFLRELPTSVLTRELHLRFLAVIDLLDPDERISELAQLIAALPLPNYSLLRALTAHLILIVQHSAENKMNMRNVGIVFSPTLGIPAGVFSLMLGEFNHVFNVDGEGEIEGEGEEVGGGEEGEEEEIYAGEEAETPATVRAKRGSNEAGSRNSRSYADGAADRLLGLSGRSLKPRDSESDDGEDEDIIHEESGTETEDTDAAAASDPGHSTPANASVTDLTDSSLHTTPKAPDSRARLIANARGLQLGPPISPLNKATGSNALPHSPRPTTHTPHIAKSPSAAHSPAPSQRESAPHTPK